MRDLEDCSCGAVGVTKASSATGHSYCLNPSCKRSKEAKESQWQPGGHCWRQRFARKESRKIRRADPQLDDWRVQQVVQESMRQAEGQQAQETPLLPPDPADLPFTSLPSTATRQQVEAALHMAGPEPGADLPEFPPCPPSSENLQGMVHQAVDQEIRRVLQRMTQTERMTQT